ncbi:DUF4238 domain-containing protein [Acinetobacter cumulans]|uniref:DUF4238 domain-containing protein n=2 Tax=Acinetobacter cumulans TaxID=2136182 RepID=A0A498DC77_9GAMM|nr:DUF4238 domain-containing protein [Acinetobacter cumulans]
MHFNTKDMFMTLKQKPIKHHFVQVSYQKQFTADNGSFWVLTKEFQYKISQKTPSQICYIPHLHTLYKYSKEFLQIENTYALIEQQMATLFEHINKNTNDLEAKDKVSWFSTLQNLKDFQTLIKFIISLTFWRNPSQQNIAKECSSKLLNLYDNSPPKIKEIFSFNREFIQYLAFNYQEENNFKIIQYLILPLVTFDLHGNDAINIVLLDENENFISCDNPVAFWGNYNELFEFKKFIFPINKNFLVLNNKETLSCDCTQQTINLLIALNAKKYIFSHSKENLEKVKENLLFFQK